jgi:hypothetical protein
MKYIKLIIAFLYVTSLVSCIRQSNPNNSFLRFTIGNAEYEASGWLNEFDDINYYTDIGNGGILRGFLTDSDFLTYHISFNDSLSSVDLISLGDGSGNALTFCTNITGLVLNDSSAVDLNITHYDSLYIEGNFSGQVRETLVVPQCSNCYCSNNIQQISGSFRIKVRN